GRVRQRGRGRQLATLHTSILTPSTARNEEQETGHVESRMIGAGGRAGSGHSTFDILTFHVRDSFLSAPRPRPAWAPPAPRKLRSLPPAARCPRRRTGGDESRDFPRPGPPDRIFPR